MNPDHRALVNLSRWLFYPIILWVMCSVLLVAFSLYLVPQFEQMYDECGLSLPPVTAAVIGVSHLVQRWWIPVLVLVTTAMVVVMGLSLFDRQRGLPTLLSWLSRLKMSSRSALAEWAWQVATLLEAGQEQADAITVAGQASSKRWLRLCSAEWSQQLRTGARPFNNITYLNSQPVHTLGCALRLSCRSDQAAMLYAIASNYRERDCNQTSWWLGWLTPLTVFIVGSSVGIFVAALFAPLIELISDLSQ